MHVYLRTTDALLRKQEEEEEAAAFFSSYSKLHVPLLRLCF